MPLVGCCGWCHARGMRDRPGARPPKGIRRAARRVIAEQLGGPVADRVIARADRSYPDIAGRIPPSGRGARHLLRMGSYAIALLDALVDSAVEPQAASGLISDAVFATIRPSRDALALVGRLRSRDHLRRALWTSGIARRFYYSTPDWVMEDVPVAGGFGMDVTRCIVAEFFASMGMGELCQQVICDQDERDATYRGIVFKRTGTLAGGADRCDFRYHLESAVAEPHT